MTNLQNLPGGAPKPEFREAIGRLAEEAREQDRLAAEKIRSLLTPRPISRFIRVGAALVVLELALLGVMYGRRHQQATATARPRSPVFADACAAVAYETYWKIAAYIRDQGHAPTALNDLIGKYLEKLPTDPASGKPLAYSTDGTRFDVHCPGITPVR